MYADIDAPVPDGASRFSVLERYLTPAGLDRVRTGTVGLSSLFPDNPVPADMWADPEFTVYAPSEYAVCPHNMMGGRST